MTAESFAEFRRHHFAALRGDSNRMTNHGIPEL